MLTLLAVYNVAAAVAAEIPARPKIGNKVAAMTFTDIRFLPRSLDDLTSDRDRVPKRAFVLVFTNTTCPVVQRYLPRLTALDDEFCDQGVQFLAVNVGPDDSVFDMATQAVEFDVPFPFVKDNGSSCVAACGVQRTPEVVLIDADHRLRYRGRIDDAYRLGGTTPATVKSYLRDAIVSLLAGEEIAVTETPVDGCLITSALEAPPTKKYTYAEHIAPLMTKHCERCHQPGTAAPFSLLSFDDVAGNAQMIAEVVEQQRMPPWYASSKFGKFTNARTMPAADRAMLLAVGMRASNRRSRPRSATAITATHGPASYGKWANRISSSRTRRSTTYLPKAMWTTSTPCCRNSFCVIRGSSLLKFSPAIRASCITRTSATCPSATIREIPSS
jgi:hypothetical protein